VVLANLRHRAVLAIKRFVYGTHEEPHEIVLTNIRMSASQQVLTANGRIRALDGWRGVSAIMVIVSHVVPGIDFLGASGVEIFFGISGYIICRGFLTETANYQRVSLIAFYVRRIFRIFPPLLIYVAMIAVLAWFEKVGPEAASIGRALTFSCNLPHADCGGWLGAHTWSLSVEEQFYIVIPVIFILLSAYRSSALTAVALCLPVIVLALYALKWTETAAFLLKFLTISMGVACALNENHMRRAAAIIPGWFAALAFVGMLGIGRFTGTPAATVVHVLLIGPLTLFVLMHAVAGKSIGNRLLASAPLSALGLISYSLYLWQQLASYSFQRRGAALFDNQPLLFRVLAVSGCFLIAFASYYLIERHLIKLGSVIANKIRGTRK